MGDGSHLSLLRRYYQRSVLYLDAFQAPGRRSSENLFLFLDAYPILFGHIR